MPNPVSQDRFLELPDEHRKILFKISATYCQSPGDREDLVQEMVLQLRRSFGRFDDHQRFTTWMYRAALNVAISFRRGETRRPRAGILPEESILQDASAPTAVGPGCSPTWAAQPQEVERRRCRDLLLLGDPGRKQPGPHADVVLSELPRVATGKKEPASGPPW